jgi:hypothetical protein
MELDFGESSGSSSFGPSSSVGELKRKEKKDKKWTLDEMNKALSSKNIVTAAEDESEIDKLDFKLSSETLSNLQSILAYTGSVDVVMIRRKVATLIKTNIADLAILVSYILLVGTNPAKGKSIAKSKKFETAFKNCGLCVIPNKPDDMSLGRLQQSCHELMVQTGTQLYDHSKEGFYVMTESKKSVLVSSALECSVWGYLMLAESEYAAYFAWLERFSKKLGGKIRTYDLKSIAIQNMKRVPSYGWLSKTVINTRRAKLGLDEFL